MDDGPVCVAVEEGADPRPEFSPTPFDPGTFFWLCALYSMTKNWHDAFPVDGYVARRQATMGWGKFDPDLEQ